MLIDSSVPQSPIEQAFLTAWNRRFPTLRLEHQYWVMGMDTATHEPRRYRVDFAYPDKRLLIELDGYQWHAGSPDVFTKHTQRQRDLEAEGWHFVRFTGSEITANAEQCAIMAWNRLLALPQNRKPIKSVIPPPPQNDHLASIPEQRTVLEPTFAAAHPSPNQPMPLIVLPHPIPTAPLVPAPTTSITILPRRARWHMLLSASLIGSVSGIWGLLLGILGFALILFQERRSSFLGIHALLWFGIFPLAGIIGGVLLGIITMGLAHRSGRMGWGGSLALLIQVISGGGMAAYLTTMPDGPRFTQPLFVGALIVAAWCGLISTVGKLRHDILDTYGTFPLAA